MNMKGVSKTRRGLSWAVVWLAIAALQTTTSASATVQGVEQEKNVIVHIGQYSNDLHSAAMGFGLANNLLNEGAEVTVFLDREGVRIADKGQPLLIYGDTDLEALVTDFVKAGGMVVVCPHCAMLGGVEGGELRQGMTLGTQQSIAQMFLRADLVVDF